MLAEDILPAAPEKVGVAERSRDQEGGAYPQEQRNCQQ
jgi:hypothetical protein